MDLTSPQNIKNLLAKHETKASKGLGQNFLIDKNVLKKIIETASIKPNETILEVGPGVGTLTQELAKKSEKVVAVEKSKKMVEILGQTLKDFKNIEIINADILKILNLKFEILNYKVVANIPYYITAPLIRKFLEAQSPPQEIILMLQKEVAQRICSTPPDMSLLALSVQFYADAKIISTVSKNCFWPSPKVDSAIIKITPQKKYEVAPDLFFKVVKAGFVQPRKQLVGNLSKILKLEKSKVKNWLASNKIGPEQRAETLSIENWVSLTNTYKM